jgi:hypothetical protein
MTPDELLRMIANHEDNFVERKTESVATSELRQTVGAFANSVPEGREAVLFIGVHDKTGEVLGVGNTDQLQKRIRDICHADCYPEIQYTAEVLTLDGKSVVAVIIPSSSAKPHFTGPAYVRVGSESLKSTPQQYDDLILSRNDKAREILKHKNDVFTVLGIGYKLGSNKPLPDGNYRERRECRVETCTGHLVTLSDIASGQRFSEPLAHVTVHYDHEKYRPMLMVMFPKG